jgi:hypothetical protein
MEGGHYQEAFWVAVAAAAPVISLAYIVFWERIASRALLDYGLRSRPLRLSGFLLAVFFGFGAPSAALMSALTSLHDASDVANPSWITACLGISLILPMILIAVFASEAAYVERLRLRKFDDEQNW